MANKTRLVQLIDVEGDTLGFYLFDASITGEYIRQFYNHWKKFGKEIDFVEHWNMRHSEQLHIEKVTMDTLTV